MIRKPKRELTEKNLQLRETMVSKTNRTFVGVPEMWRPPILTNSFAKQLFPPLAQQNPVIIFASHPRPRKTHWSVSKNTLGSV